MSRTAELKNAAIVGRARWLDRPPLLAYHAFSRLRNPARAWDEGPLFKRPP